VKGIRGARTVDLSEEEQYLKEVLRELRKAADKLLGTEEYYSDRSAEQARYLWENQAEFDGYEMQFLEQALNHVVDVGEEAREQLRRIVKQLDSPYFARIDFRMPEEEAPVKVYIGRFSFWKPGSPVEIYDWRAPIASMYYEFEDGDAWYDAPDGRISGVIDCKRQYRIRKGVLEYALESSVSIDDEILQRELSKASDHRMRDIVATIQKEQNRLIRNESAEVLIIQGVAGSGKTSIALHRIAYFLYRYRKEITSKNFLIISPNGIFVDYISNVLPELGEEPVKNVGMEEIAKWYLPGELKTERLCGQAERYQASVDEAWRERNAFKATREFVTLLEGYLEHCDQNNFVAVDYRYECGSIDAEFIHRRYVRLTAFPVRRRLEEVASAMAEELRLQRKAKGWGTHKKEILEWLTQQYRHNDALELYQYFYRLIGREELFVWTEECGLESADIFPLLYVKLYLEGCRGDERIKHLVIDEMQDYSPIQYAVLNRLYPCRKTILGDFSQKVVPFVHHSLDFLKELYPSAQVIEIHKSYRSTCEIMEFAQGLCSQIVVDPILRHGEKPQLVDCLDEKEEREKILERVEKAIALGGSVKLGIICKNYAQAEELYLWLEGQLMGREKISGQETERAQGAECRFHLLTYDSAEFYDGVMVTAVSMAKGLEFDEVLLPDVADWNYQSEYDRGLLYVACTRAMHRLTLLYSGKPSRFLTGS